MSDDDRQSNYFIRIRGKVLGPYTIKQLNMLRARGQFSQTNEVSTDGTNWESAARLYDVFETAPATIARTRKESSAESEFGRRGIETKPGSDEAQWYYSLDGKQLGPVPQSEVVQMLSIGAMNSHDLVWTEGMNEWQPSADRLEFANSATAKSRKSSPAHAAEESGSSNVPPHFLDYLLSGIRNGLNESSIRSLERIPIEIGRWAVYFAILLSLVLYSFLGVKSGYPLFSLLGIGMALIFLANQYGAIKILGAMSLSLRSNPQRMSSTAFLDLLAVSFVAQGVVALCAGVCVSVLLKLHFVLLIGIAVFLLLVPMAFVLLNPRALAITINKRASVAEDALSIVTFVCMLPVRFALPAFAVGALIGDVGTIVMFCLLMGHKEVDRDFFLSMEWTQNFLAVVQTSTSIPFFAYLYYVLASLSISLVQAILSIPGKLDDVAKQIPGVSNAANSDIS